MQWNSSELLPLADDINDSLVPVGLEIANLEAANLAFLNPVVSRVSRIA